MEIDDDSSPLNIYPHSTIYLVYDDIAVHDAHIHSVNYACSIDLPPWYEQVRKDMTVQADITLGGDQYGFDNSYSNLGHNLTVIQEREVKQWIINMGQQHRQDLCSSECSQVVWDPSQQKNGMTYVHATSWVVQMAVQVEVALHYTATKSLRNHSVT